MTKTSKGVVTAALVALGGVAEAGGQAGTLGVGGEFMMSGVGGASVNYDAGDFHVGGFLGFSDSDAQNGSAFEIGGRFYYHVHSTAMSDFGVGGALGIASVPDNNPAVDQRSTLVYAEPGVQIRLFLASNVALSATTGIILGVSDADGVAITGSTLGGRAAVTAGGISFGGGLGLHYYFF